MNHQPNVVSFAAARSARTHAELLAFCEGVERMSRDVMASVSYVPAQVGSPDWEKSVTDTYGEIAGVLVAVANLKAKLGQPNDRSAA